MLLREDDRSERGAELYDYSSHQVLIFLFRNLICSLNGTMQLLYLFVF